MQQNMQNTNMNAQQMNLLFKILTLVGVILGGIAIIVPWGLWTYLFGFLTPISADYFYITTMTANITWQGIVFGIIMIISFVMALVLLIMGIKLVIKNIPIHDNSYLKPAIIAMVIFILYIININVTNISAIGYGAGFFLMIVTMIVYFVTFALKKMLMPSTIGYNTQQGMYQPQQQMYAQNPQPSAYYMQQQNQQPYQQPVTPTPQQQTQPQPQPVQQNAVPKFCQKCGNQLKPGAAFCPNCGNKI